MRFVCQGWPAKGGPERKPFEPDQDNCRRRRICLRRKVILESDKSA